MNHVFNSFQSLKTGTSEISRLIREHFYRANIHLRIQAYPMRLILDLNLDIDTIGLTKRVLFGLTS